MRHDMLGCLNSIRLSMEAVKIAENSEEVAMFLDCIAQEVEKTQKLIDDAIPPKNTVSVLPFQCEVRVHDRPHH